MAWWRRYFLSAEAVVALAVVIGLAIWLAKFGGQAKIQPLLNERRGTLYGILVGVHASLLGFVLTTTSIVLSQVVSERFALVRESQHYPTLWQIFTSAVRGYGFAALAALAALLFDREPPANNTLAMLAVVGTTTLSSLRLGRTVWALEKIITVATARTRR